MKWHSWLGTVLLSLVCGEPGLGSEFLSHTSGSEGAGEVVCSDACTPVKTDCSAKCSRLTCWCPDDYCPKKCPRFCLPPTCGPCDDYCPKRFPCFNLPATRGCRDDYCPKRCPSVVWPCRYPDYYRCGPPNVFRPTDFRCDATAGRGK